MCAHTGEQMTRVRSAYQGIPTEESCRPSCPTKSSTRTIPVFPLLLPDFGFKHRDTWDRPDETSLAQRRDLWNSDQVRKGILCSIRRFILGTKGHR